MIFTVNKSRVTYPASHAPLLSDDLSGSSEKEDCKSSCATILEKQFRFSNGIYKEKEVTNMEKKLLFKISLLISFMLTAGGLLLTLCNYFLFFNYPFLNQTTVGLLSRF